MKKRNFIIIAIVALIGVAFVFNACKSDDTTAPVITLKGNPTYDVILNSSASWVDPGATSKDDKDGDLTSTIKVTGTVDNNLAKEYTLTYSSTDAAGNIGTATRKVTVYNEAKAIVGSYDVDDLSNGNHTPYVDNVSVSTVINNKINFTKFAAYINAAVYGNVSGNTITIPSQTVECGTAPARYNHTFTGSGTFTSTTITINYHDVCTELGTFDGVGTYTRQ